MGSLTSDAKRIILTRINQQGEEVWEGSLRYLNDEQGWNLHWHEEKNSWHLTSWKHLIIEVKKWSLVEAFVYGMIFGAAHTALELMRPTQTRRPQTLIFENNLVRKSEHSQVFERLRRLSGRIYEVEKDLSAVGRGDALYSNYQQGRFSSRYARKLEELAVLFQEKRLLESELLVDSLDEIAKLKDAARNLRAIDLDNKALLATALAFLTVQLHHHWSWYETDGSWLLLAGSKRVYHSDDSYDFMTFSVGAAYYIGSLPEEMLG